MIKSRIGDTIRNSPIASFFSPIIVNWRQNDESLVKPVTPTAVVVVPLILKNLCLSIDHKPSPFKTSSSIVPKGRLAFPRRLGDRDAHAMVPGQIDRKGARHFNRSRSQRLPVHIHIPIGAREIIGLDGPGVVQVVPVHIDIGLHLVGLGEPWHVRPIQEVLGKIVRVVALEGMSGFPDRLL